MDTVFRYRVLLRCAAVALALVGWPPGRSDASPISPAAKAAARQEFNLGERSFEKQAYAEALQHYKRAHALAPLPGFLFNIGQCHRNLGHLDEAVQAYERYLNELPQARNRKAVEALIADLKQKINARTPKPAGNGVPDYRPQPEPHDNLVTGPAPVITPSKRPDRPPKRPRSKPFYKSWWFWVPVGALVVGGAAAGSYFAFRDNGPSLPASELGELDAR